MKTLITLLMLVSSASSYAQTPNADIVISGGGISIVVRGSGGFVCSAQDSMKEKPRLGRGATRAEAQANAIYLASLTNGGNDFFVKIISCEPSKTGAGGISIASDAGGLRILVEGPTEVQCIAKNSMKGAFPYIATAATQTEAYALASNACTVGSNDDGFFCKTACQRIATSPAPSGQVVIPGVKLPKIKLRNVIRF